MVNITIVLFVFYVGIYKQEVYRLLYYTKVNFLSKTALRVVVKIIATIVLAC